MPAPIVFEATKHTRWRLEAIGPVLPKVKVALHPETGKVHRSLGRPIPDPAEVDGLIDTGSDICVVQHKLAEKLELQQVDLQKLSAVHGEAKEVPVYYARLILPNGVQHKTRLMGASLTGAYKLILGRDLLRKCVFTYDGFSGSYSLVFSAPKH